MGELVESARKALKEILGELFPSEIMLLKNVAESRSTDYRVNDKEKDDPSNADKWEGDRVIRADVIDWLCTARSASSFITCKGIIIGGAKIVGRINIAFAVMEYPFTLAFCYIPNGIDMGYARVNFLKLDGSHIAHLGKPEDPAFIGDGIVVRGSIYFRDGARFLGETRLLGAEIGAQLNCRGSQFINPGSETLNADGIKVKGSIIFREGAEFHGTTRLLAADIDGDLDCSGCRFINQNGIAFATDGMRIKGKVVFGNAANFHGETRITDSEIGGELNCRGSSFINPHSIAFYGDRITVHGSAFLDNGATFEGQTNLSSARIGCMLAFDGATFLNEGAIALTLQSATVAQQLLLNNISDIKGAIILTDAIVNILMDDDKYWKHHQIIFLDGFKYSRIHCAYSKLLTVKERLKWLSLQPKDRFHPQPYDQLSRAFRNMGQEKDAREVLIAKQKDGRKHLGPFLRAWSFMLHLTTGYGYQMWRALLFAVVFIAIGYFKFDNAYRAGLMTPVKFANKEVEIAYEYYAEKIRYPSFSPIIYSVDAFLPIVDLHQESHWLPKSNEAGAGWVWRYLYFHIFMGWLLTTLVVVAVTGLVRRE